MTDYTQEQLDLAVKTAVENATKGLFSEDELNRRVTSEVDRRVESGIQKGLETQRKKWEDEFSKKAQMTAEELAKVELESKMAELTGKERELLKKTNLISAKEVLSEAGVPASNYNKFLDVLVSDDAEVTMAKVNDFVEMFNSTRLDIETKVKASFSQVPPPSSGGAGGEITKEGFAKMSYSERLQLKSEKPELYAQLIK